MRRCEFSAGHIPHRYGQEGLLGPWMDTLSANVKDGGDWSSTDRPSWARQIRMKVDGLLSLGQ